MLYTIVLIGALFGGQVTTEAKFITPEACKAIAVRLTQASGMTHVCQKTM